MSLSKTEREYHQKSMARCFNAAWVYLEARRRSSAEARSMLHLAHAARYHASLVGTARNEAIGDWQVSRVYSELGDARLALEFANSCREVCEANGLVDLLCTADEALARAYAIGADAHAARECLRQARQHLAAASVDAEDRRIYSAQIRATERLVRRLRAGTSA